MASGTLDFGFGSERHRYVQCKLPPASAFASGAVAPPIAPVERIAPDLAIPEDVLAPAPDSTSEKSL